MDGGKYRALYPAANTRSSLCSDSLRTTRAEGASGSALRFNDRESGVDREERLAVLDEVIIEGHPRDGHITRATAARNTAPARDVIELVLRSGRQVPSIAGSCSHILEHSDALWTFLARDGVEPTNNDAERELRGLVLWRKTTLGSHSARGDEFMCPCGCGQMIALNLMVSHYPRWTLSRDSVGRVTLFPSIHSTTCGAHFSLRSNNVEWCRDS